MGVTGAFWRGAALSYDANQREALRLICGRCGQMWDVTRWDRLLPYVCVRCRRKP